MVGIKMFPVLHLVKNYNFIVCLTCTMWLQKQFSYV